MLCCLLKYLLAINKVSIYEPIHLFFLFYFFCLLLAFAKFAFLFYLFNFPPILQKFIDLSFDGL